MSISNLEYMRLHLGALYICDSRDRISGCNQFDGGEVPRFHLARTDVGNLCLFRNDVPDRLVASIRQLVEREPGLDDPQAPPRFEEEYLQLLSGQAPVETRWRGLTYRFTQLVDAAPPKVVAIHASNRQLLEAHLPEWLPDVRYRHPFLAWVEEGHAVAVCASARMTPDAHEAGVETVPAYRRRGYAAGVVSAWARAVTRENAVPLYSTSWDNLSSRSVADTLGMELVGADFHIR